MTESVLTRLLKPLPTPEAWREKLGLSTSGDVSALLGALLTNQGDLAVRGASAVERFGIGASGTILRSNGTDPGWATQATALGDILTDQGMILRRTASGVEGYQANTNNTLLGGNGSGVASRDATFVRSMLDIVQGLYTPTLTIVTNLDAVTAYQASYIQIDDRVLVFGYFEANATAAAFTEMRMSVPIASNFATSLQGGGGGGAHGANAALAIRSDAASNDLTVTWVPSFTTNAGYSFVVGYSIV